MPWNILSENWSRSKSKSLQLCLIIRTSWPILLVASLEMNKPGWGLQGFFIHVRGPARSMIQHLKRQHIFISTAAPINVVRQAAFCGCLCVCGYRVCGMRRRDPHRGNIPVFGHSNGKKEHVPRHVLFSLNFLTWPLVHQIMGAPMSCW